jgi:hypothetical protein
LIAYGIFFELLIGNDELVAKADPGLVEKHPEHAPMISLETRINAGFNLGMVFRPNQAAQPFGQLKCILKGIVREQSRDGVRSVDR